MADRRISINITVQNRQAIQATNEQTAATNNLNQATDKHTHLQNGLTNSFIKGNLAARAISVAYISIRDSMKAAFGEAIALEHTMTKMAAVTDASDTVIRAMSGNISVLAAETKQSHNELAKAALEMSKMGLSAAQTQLALGGVAKLARALDEDLTRTGEAVVAVLNTYGLSADQAAKVTNQLAFTVKASALSIESFSTAFSYVGGTAAAAGVSLSELQGAMDVLSNSGIRSSTIGTQLRRVIADLSDSNSDAAKVLGGRTLQSYGSLEKALDALAQKNLSASDLTAIFGRTASSVAAILIKYRGVLGDLGEQTENVGNIVDGMTQKMNTTFKSSIDSVKVSWTELGVQIMQSSGLMKAAVDQVDLAVRTLAERMELSNQVKRFKKEAFPGYVAVTQDVGDNDNAIAQHPVFQRWLQMEREAKDLALRMDNIVDELKKTLVRDVKELTNSETVDKADIENTFLFKKLAQEYAGAGYSKSDFLTKLSMARDKLLRELAPTNEGLEGLDGLLDSKKPEIEFDPMDVFDRLQDMDDSGRTYKEKFDTKRDESRSKAEEKAAESMEKFAKTINKVSSKKEYEEWLAKQSVALDALRISQDAVNGSIGILSGYLAEGLLSDGKDPFKGISDAFGDFAKKMAADITALIIKLLVFKAVLALVGGKSGGGFFSWGFNNQGGSGFQNFLLQSLGGQKFASGTDQIVRSPTAFIAGDGGPEKVTVTPRAKMGSSEEKGSTIIIQGDVYDYERFARKVKEAQEANRRNFV